MKHASLFTLVLALLLCGCAASTQTARTSPQPASAPSTILLVSLEDGTVIKQQIEVEADVCFKQNTSSQTTCFTQGAPVVDPQTGAVVGYEMIQNQIELIARSD